MFGAYETIEKHPALQFERRLSHPVEVVWRAITDSGELEHWFPSKVEVGALRTGAEMTFTFEHMPLEDAPMTLHGRVTEFDPPRRFAFYWGDDHLRFVSFCRDNQKQTVLRSNVEPASLPPTDALDQIGNFLWVRDDRSEGVGYCAERVD